MALRIAFMVFMLSQGLIWQPIAGTSLASHVAYQNQNGPDQPNIAEPEPYPPNWFCTPDGIVANGVPTKDHPCHCHRMNLAADCDDPNMDTHDAQCNQYCSESHCRCPIECTEKPR